MKKLVNFLFLSLSFSLMLIFSGCEKDLSGEPTTENPNIKPAISVDMIPEDGIVDAGEDVTFLFAVSANTKEMTINGEDITLPISTYVVPNVKTNTTFVFIVENDAGRTVRTKNIVVRDQVFPLPTITLTANPDTLPIGGGITTLSWSSENTDTVLISGTQHGPNGSMEIEFDSTSEISALAKGKGGENTSSLSVYVLTMDNLLASGTRTYVKGEFYDTLGVLMYAFFEYENSIPCLQDDTRTFTMNPNISILDFGVQCGENITTYPETWSLNDSILTIGNSIVEIKIVILTEDVLVYTIPSCSYVGDKVIPIVAKYTYKNLP